MNTPRIENIRAASMIRKFSRRKTHDDGQYYFSFFSFADSQMFLLMYGTENFLSNETLQHSWPAGSKPNNLFQSCKRLVFPNFRMLLKLFSLKIEHNKRTHLPLQSLLRHQIPNKDPIHQDNARSYIRPNDK